MNTKDDDDNEESEQENGDIHDLNRIKKRFVPGEGPLRRVRVNESKRSSSKYIKQDSVKSQQRNSGIKRQFTSLLNDGFPRQTVSTSRVSANKDLRMNHRGSVTVRLQNLDDKEEENKKNISLKQSEKQLSESDSYNLSCLDEEESKEEQKDIRRASACPKVVGKRKMMASDNKHISAPEPKMRPKNFNNSHKKGLGDRLQKPDLR